VSKLHRLRSDEIFHFYAGDPVEMLLLRDGSGEVVTLGADLAHEMRPQVIVPRGVWQGCRLRPGGLWALMGTTVSPGFAYEDFEMGSSAELAALHPAHADLIRTLGHGP
jgi:predicted cupin superfamily sugar epimerase